MKLYDTTGTGSKGTASTRVLLYTKHLIMARTNDGRQKEKIKILEHKQAVVYASWRLVRLVRFTRKPFLLLPLNNIYLNLLPFLSTMFNADPQ